MEDFFQYFIVGFLALWFVAKILKSSKKEFEAKFYNPGNRLIKIGEVEIDIYTKKPAELSIELKIPDLPDTGFVKIFLNQTLLHTIDLQDPNDDFIIVPSSAMPFQENTVLNDTLQISAGHVRTKRKITLDRNISIIPKQDMCTVECSNGYRMSAEFRKD